VSGGDLDAASAPAPRKKTSSKAKPAE
jgi:hypothetical protein